MTMELSRKRTELSRRKRERRDRREPWQENEE